MIRTLCLVFVVALIGCETGGPQHGQRRLSKNVKTYTVFETHDLLYTQGLGEAGIPGFTRRIQYYLAKDLAKRGITCSSEGAQAGDAKLTVRLDTIESATVTDIGFWAPIIRQQPKVKYEATLASSDGTTLFTLEDQQDDPSLDTLSKKIAERLGGRVAKWYE